MLYQDKLALYSVLAMLCYIISLLLIIFAKSSNRSNDIKIKKNSKAYKSFSKRLQNIVSDADTKMNEEDKVFVMTGRKSGPIRRLKKELIKTFSGGVFGTGVIKALFFAISGAVIIGGLSFLVTANPVIGLANLINLVLLALTGVNVYKLMKEINIYDQIANFMTVNYSQYLSSNNFEESIDKTLTALRPGTLSYLVASRFRNKVFEYNVPLKKAIEDMKEDFVNASHIVQYLDIVYKAETVDPAYKKSVGGIPENFSMTIAQKKDFAISMAMIYGISVAVSMAAIVYTIIAGMFSSSFIYAITTSTGAVLLTVSSVGMAFFQLIIFKSTSRGAERVWDNE